MTRSTRDAKKLAVRYYSDRVKLKENYSVHHRCRMLKMFASHSSPSPLVILINHVPFQLFLDPVWLIVGLAFFYLYSRQEPITPVVDNSFFMFFLQAEGKLVVETNRR